jgi:MYXO-CTERM domain-containing protein
MRTTIVFGLVVALGLSLSARARADVLPEGKKHLSVKFSVASDDKSLFVAFPAACGPMSSDNNYDVLEPKSPREPYKFCGDSALYALDASAFTKVEAKEKPMAWFRSPWLLTEIEKVPQAERPKFFASTASVHAVGYALPPFALVDTKIPLKEVQEIVTVKGNKAESVALTYVYADGAEEKHSYAPGKRPQPDRKEARDWMAGLVDTNAVAPGPTTAPTATSATDAKTVKASACGCASAPGSGAGGALVLAFAVLGLRRRPRSTPTS